MSRQGQLFGETVDKETLLRNFFENTFFIPHGEIDKDFGWGIRETRYVFKGNNRWIFGFLCKVMDGSNLTTLPTGATSIEELGKLKDSLVLTTPFFFDFVTQHLYTQSHHLIVKASKSASETWAKILKHQLNQHILGLDVQSIPESKDFWKQMEKIDVLQIAEFNLFAPNALNEDRIRAMINQFEDTEMMSLTLVLKNLLTGLKKDAEDIVALLRYVLRGGGKGKVSGLEVGTGRIKTVQTDSSLQVLSVSNLLNEESSINVIEIVIKEIMSSQEGKSNV